MREAPMQLVSEKSRVVAVIGHTIKNNRNPNFLKYGESDTQMMS